MMKAAEESSEKYFGSQGPGLDPLYIILVKYRNHSFEQPEFPSSSFMILFLLCPVSLCEFLHVQAIPDAGIVDPW